MTFADVVKEVRKRLGISQEDLAHSLNVSFATINRWENGKTSPNKLTRKYFYDFCQSKGIEIGKDIYER
jgi:putative transcriptional regulator